MIFWISRFFRSPRSDPERERRKWERRRLDPEKRKKDYMRWLDSFIRVGEQNLVPEMFWDGLKALVDWAEGVPIVIYHREVQEAERRGETIPNAERIKARYANAERIVIEPALRRIGEMVANALRELGLKVYPQRFRPAYLEVAKLLPLASYYGWNRERIAREAGVSRATVRDTIWYMRRVGFQMPYGAFAFEFPR